MFLLLQLVAVHSKAAAVLGTRITIPSLREVLILSLWALAVPEAEVVGVPRILSPLLSLEAVEGRRMALAERTQVMEAAMGGLLLS